MCVDAGRIFLNMISYLEDAIFESILTIQRKKWQLRFCLLFRGWLWYSSSSLVWSPQTSEKWPWRFWLTRFSSKLVAFRGLSWFLLNLLDETIIYWILSALYLMYVQWSQKWFYEMNIPKPLNHFAFRHSKFYKINYFGSCSKWTVQYRSFSPLNRPF